MAEITGQLELPLYNRSTDLGGHSKQVRDAAVDFGERKFSNSERAEQMRGSMRVRPLSIDDAEYVIGMGRELHAMSMFSHLDYSEHKLRNLATVIIAQKNEGSYCCFVAEVDDSITGFMVAYVAPHGFGDDLVARDFTLYVHPRWRGTWAAVKLIRAYEAWAAAKGVKSIALATTSGLDTERVAALYTRLGYTCVGHVFRKEA